MLSHTDKEDIISRDCTHTSIEQKKIDIFFLQNKQYLFIIWAEIADRSVSLLVSWMQCYSFLLEAVYEIF
jgi:hypothetical protein